MPTTDALAIRRKIIGVLLQGARVKAGRTKKECAEVIGVTPGILSAYEEGRRDMSLPELELLAYYLHVPVAGFLEGEDETLVSSDSPPGSEAIALRNRIIGVLLREVREHKGKTQKDLAEVVGCNARRIGQYEAGQIPIPVTQLETLADELDVPLSHFLDEGIGKVGERELQDRQLEAWKALPEDIREFAVQPSSLTYLRVAMHLAQLPADAIRKLAEGLLEITY